MIVQPPIAVFDLDGTLVHTAPDLVGSLSAALSGFGFSIPDYAELSPYAGTGGRGMLNHYAMTRGLQFSENDVAKIISFFVDDYESKMPGVSAVYDGALTFVTDLRAAGFKTAICTNKPQKLTDKLLRKLDLAKHFDAVCAADYFTVRKPDPLHLTGTIKVADGDQSRAIMFGDSQTDFDTANAAGIPIVGVTFGYSPVPVHEFKVTKIISHYSEMTVAITTELLGG